MQLPDNSVFVIFAIVAGLFAFRVLKYGGLRGALYGSRVSRTVGEIDLGRRGPATSTLRVHVLEDGVVVVEQSSRAFLGGSIQGFHLSRQHVGRLIDLLKAANDA